MNITLNYVFILIHKTKIVIKDVLMNYAVVFIEFCLYRGKKNTTKLCATGIKP